MKNPTQKPTERKPEESSNRKTPFYHIDRSKEEIIWSNTLWDRRRRPVLWVERAGTTFPDKNYRIARRASGLNSCSVFVFEYVCSGKGYIESMGEKTEVGAGDFYLIHGKFSHCYYSDASEPFEKKWINVRGSFLDALEPMFLQGKPYMKLALGESGEQVMDAIHQRIRRATPADSEEMLTDVMKHILDLFLLCDRFRSEEMEKMSWEEQIVRYVEQNICLDLHVQDLCQHFYISPSTLYRHFTTQFGISPKDFIMKKKIEASKRMIAANESTFQSIATVLHFCDVHHFFRCFRNETGMSPSEYRTKILSEDADV